MVRISSSSSDCFIRIPLVLTQLQDEICEVINFLCALASQKTTWVCGQGGICGVLWYLPRQSSGGKGCKVHSSCITTVVSSFAWRNSADITRKSRSQQSPQGYQLLVEGKKRQSKASHFLTAREEACVAPEHVSFITAAKMNAVSFPDTFLLPRKQNSS